MLTRLLFNCMIAAFLALSTPWSAHAGTVTPADQPIGSFKHFGGGFGGFHNGSFSGSFPFSEVKFEVGFAIPSVTPIEELNQPIFSNTKLTTSSDGVRFFANAKNTPGFTAFTDAFHQQDQGTFYTLVTALDGAKPNHWLTRMGARPLDESGSPLHYTLAPDLKAFKITGVELVVDLIDIETQLDPNGLAKTSFFQKHTVNIYGHAKSEPPRAVPTPTAAAAGLGLLGIALSRRRSRDTRGPQH